MGFGPWPRCGSLRARPPNVRPRVRLQDLRPGRTSIDCGGGRRSSAPNKSKKAQIPAWNLSLVATLLGCLVSASVESGQPDRVT